MARIHRVNPDLAGDDRHLWDQVCSILETFQPDWVERGGHDQLRRFLARLVWGDHAVRLELVVDEDRDEERVVALGLATLEAEGLSRWVFCQVGWVAPGEDRTLATQYLEDLKDWGRSLDARWLVYASRRTPGALERRFKGAPGGVVLHRFPIKAEA